SVPSRHLLCWLRDRHPTVASTSCTKPLAQLPVVALHDEDAVAECREPILAAQEVPANEPHEHAGARHNEPRCRHQSTLQSRCVSGAASPRSASSSVISSSRSSSVDASASLATSISC